LATIALIADWSISRESNRVRIHGPKAILKTLDIKEDQRYHGANDAAYTAFVLGATALACAQEDAAFPVAREPLTEVGRIVDKKRTLCYTKSSSQQFTRRLSVTSAEQLITPKSSVFAAVSTAASVAMVMIIIAT
jgi:hypothetical protein